MPNTREKLIELIRYGRQRAENICNENSDCQSCIITDPNGNCKYGCIADHLIAHGVTIQSDCHWATEQAFKNGYLKGYDKGLEDAMELQKWIPVTERLPEPFTDVLSYSGHRTLMAVDCVDEKGKWYSEYKYDEHPVTHWMPLPEPPKGE